MSCGSGRLRESDEEVGIQRVAVSAGRMRSLFSRRAEDSAMMSQ